MIVNLTEDDYENLWDESWGNDDSVSTWNGWEGSCNLPKQLANGKNYFFLLQNGLEVEIDDFEYKEICNRHVDHDDSPYLISKFYLSGSQRVFTPDVKDISNDYEEVAGKNYLFYLPDLHEFERNPVGKHVRRLRIIMSWEFLKLFETSADVLPPKLQQLLEGDFQHRFHQPLKTTIEMQKIIRQMFDCAYCGLIKRMYLEAKALELLSLQFTCWKENSHHLDKVGSLRNGDLERLYQAKDILDTCLGNPPSLLDLVQQVGLSEFKLKHGFREVFGTTVWEYAQAYRMERAKRMLVETKLSVVEIAHAIGYATQSHFGYMFKQHFYLTPKEFRDRHA
jgi:AraC-like DNA-binding protein